MVIAAAAQAQEMLEPSTEQSIDPLTSTARRKRFPVGSTYYNNVKTCNDV